MGLLSNDNKTRKAFQKMVGKGDWKSKITCTDDASELIEATRTMIEQNPKLNHLILLRRIEMLKDYIEGASPKMSYKEWEDGLQF